MQDGLRVISGPVWAEEAELLADVVKVVRWQGGERGVEALGIEAPGGGDVVKIAGKEVVVDGEAVGELLGEDLSIGFKRDAGASHGVAGDGLLGEGGAGEDGDLAVPEHDEGIARENADVLDDTGVPFKVGGELLGVPHQLEVGLAPDEEVHVGAVAVRPAGGKSGAATEAEVAFAAQVIGKRLANGFKQFGGTARKVELGHQTEILSTLRSFLDVVRRDTTSRAPPSYKALMPRCLNERITCQA